MSESGMRSKVIQKLYKLDAVAVENPAYPGTPDVNYIDGWIELKWVRALPANEDTQIKLDHYTPQQKLWIRRRHLAGGRVFLLVQIKKEWFLFKYPETNNVGSLTRKQMIEQSYKYWKSMNWEELILCLN